MANLSLTTSGPRLLRSLRSTSPRCRVSTLYQKQNLFHALYTFICIKTSTYTATTHLTIHGLAPFDDMAEVYVGLAIYLETHSIQNCDILLKRSVYIWSWVCVLLDVWSVHVLLGPPTV